MSEVSIIFYTCLSFNSKSHLVSDPTEKEKLTSVTGFQSVNILLLIILMVLILSCFMVALIPPADSNTYCLMLKPKKECTGHMVLGRHFIWSWRPLLMFLNMTLKFSSVSESRNQYSLIGTVWNLSAILAYIIVLSCRTLLSTDNSTLHMSYKPPSNKSTWNTLPVSFYHSTWM